MDHHRRVAGLDGDAILERLHWNAVLQRFLDADDLADEPADGDDLVAFPQREQRVLLLFPLLLLRTDHQEIEDQADQRELQDQLRPRTAGGRCGLREQRKNRAHDGSGLEWYRASQSRLHASKVPARIAARARRIRAMRKCTLCRERRRRARISSLVTRCRRYALEKRRQAGHPHSSSSGRGSSRWAALRRLILPVGLNAAALRPIRVGATQSNRSTPRATPSTRSSGKPTPIR